MNTKQFLCVFALLCAWQVDLETAELENQQEAVQEQLSPDNLTDAEAE